jgi:hypothetical protein
MRRITFSQINKITINPETKRVVNSNHPRFRKGYAVSEPMLRECHRYGWQIVRYDPYRVLTEQLSTEELLDNVILARSEDFKWTAFEKDDDMIFAQTRKGKVVSQNSEGEETVFDSVEEFLKVYPGYVLAGIVDEDQIEGDE